jgi:hypothetical protein
MFLLFCGIRDTHKVRYAPQNNKNILIPPGLSNYMAIVALKFYEIN